MMMMMMMTCVQEQRALQIEDAGSERQAGRQAGRQPDRQTDRQTGRVRDTQQADGGGREPPGSPVMKTVGNTTQRVHGMF